MDTKTRKPKLIPAENDKMLALLNERGRDVRKVTFAGAVYWWFLSAHGIREAERRGVKVFDHVLEAMNRSQSLAGLHRLMMEAVEKKVAGDPDVQRELEGADPEEIAGALSDMLYQQARETLGEMSIDRLMTSMAAAFWAGLLPLYPSISLAEIDVLMDAREVEHVQEQIADVLLSALESAQDATERRERVRSNGALPGDDEEEGSDQGN